MRKSTSNPKRAPRIVQIASVRTEGSRISPYSSLEQIIRKERHEDTESNANKSEDVGGRDPHGGTTLSRLSIPTKV